VSSPDVDSRLKTMTRYLKNAIKFFGEQRACQMMRSHLGWFVKGMRYSSRFRKSVVKISSEDEALSLINAYREALQSDSGLNRP